MSSIIRKQITCEDGTVLSVQASEYHYCSPRNDVGPYTHVEVGYPSSKPPQEWASCMDGSDFDIDWDVSVYAWVPIELVEEYINDHGGAPMWWKGETEIEIEV